MKSRVVGIKIAKGKYITIMDGDDALIHKDILKNSFFIAQKAKLMQNSKVYYLIKEKGQKQYMIIVKKMFLILYISQPELKYKIININSIFENRVIWVKLIKNELLKKVLIYIGPELTEDYINEAEDTFLSIGPFHLAKSYYIMKEEGYYYSQDEKNKAS